MLALFFRRGTGQSALQSKYYNLVLLGLGASDRRRCMRRETADRQAAKDAGKETQEKQTVPSCYLEQRNKRKGIRETHVARPHGK
jgi:hypothetical protein